MSTKSMRALATTFPALLALIFSLLNLCWWAMLFSAQPEPGNWAISCQLGTYPIYLPAALLHEWFGIDLISLPPLNWFFEPAISTNQTYYRFAFLGIVGWGGVGYALGWIGLTATRILTQRFGRRAPAGLNGKASL